MNIDGGGGNISDEYVFKEIWSILQLPINFSYTFDARFVKHPFLIHLSMLIMAMYIKSNSEFLNSLKSFFLWFYTKHKFSALKKISLIS